MDRAHLRLVIGVADVEVYVWNQVQGPLLPGLQRFGESLFSAVQVHLDLRGGDLSELRNQKLNALFAKVSFGLKVAVEAAVAKAQADLVRAEMPCVANEDIHAFFEGAAVVLIEDCRLSLGCDGRKLGKRLQLNGVVIESGIGNALITGRHRLQGNLVSALMQPGARNIAENLRTRVGREKGVHRVAHRVVELRMQNKTAPAAIDGDGKIGDTGVFNDYGNSKAVRRQWRTGKGKHNGARRGFRGDRLSRKDRRGKGIPVLARLTLGGVVDDRGVRLRIIEFG